MNVQTQFLDNLATRVVIPLMRLHQAPTPVKELNPVFDIAGDDYVLVTQAIASVPAKEPKKPIASLDGRHDAITRALEILLPEF